MFFALSLLSLSACAAEPVGLVTVDVATGLVPGPEFRTVTIEVFELSEVPAENRTHYEEAPATVGDDFVRGRRITELALSPGVHRITVRLLRPDRRLLVSLSHLVTVSADGARIARFHITRDCVGEAICPSPGGSAALTECLGGHCVDPRCEPPDPTYCPDILFCHDDGECPTTAACAVARCVDGICTEEPVGAACASGEYCNPTLGCVSLETPVDPVASCGEFCEDACAAGIWACDTSPPHCSIVTFKDAGVPCEGGTCDGAGACVP